MDDIKTLIKALRCSAGYSECMDENCPYRVEEAVKPELPVKPDIVRDGIGYWISCDVDSIAAEAADALERLMREETGIDVAIVYKMEGE